MGIEEEGRGAMLPRGGETGVQGVLAGGEAGRRIMRVRMRMVYGGQRVGVALVIRGLGVVVVVVEWKLPLALEGGESIALMPLAGHVKRDPVRGPVMSLDGKSEGE